MNGHTADGNGVDIPLRIGETGNSLYPNGHNGRGLDSASASTQNGQRNSEDSSSTNGSDGSSKDSARTLIEQEEKTNGNIGTGYDVKETPLDVTGNGHVEVDDGIAGNGENKGTVRPDEYDLDFSNTRRFAMTRWNDILISTALRLKKSDLEIARKYHDWQDLSSEIQAKILDPASTPVVKRNMSKIQPLPSVLAKLFSNFSRLLVPFEAKYDLVWGLTYLNLKLSYASPERLTRTADLLQKLRRVIELFNRCIDACHEDNESRIAMVDFLDPVTIILTDSITYLREFTSDKAANQAWPDLNDSINEQLNTLDQTVKHVNDITSLSAVNQDRKIKNMSLRHALIPEPEEPGIFPNKILPSRARNDKFYGRRDELDRIAKYLNPKGDQSFRTYTIYGRRGVGKTEIALQFAHTNPCGFDAIFWIQCETSVAIRQSFTKVAVSLNLPGADSDGHHEENLGMVHDWLKKTKKRWLLIFDNAESNQILRNYWPVGGSGAILTTSRRYYNFAKDIVRKGDTIKPFDAHQSWDLLLQLLGDEWRKMDQENRIEPSEVASAKALLGKLGGLALAIQQAAQLINNSEIGGPTITKTYEEFEKRLRSLPERHQSVRSDSEKSLDALWDMIFNALSPNARVLLGVLAWLSPDLIQAQLFHPRNQAALDGALSFCKQEAIDGHQRASLYTLITPSPDFEKAIQELLIRDLIKQQSPRFFSIHRVVQEATSFHDTDELQESFETASRLVNEQFPNRRKDDNLYSKWSTCQDYIPHGVHLSRKFQDYAPSGNLKGSPDFIELLSNCAWYLHELGDYEISKRILDTAISSCDDKSGLTYADLLNTAGCRNYELNRLPECRRAWEECMVIRKEHLPHNDIFIAAIYNNLGNLELAQGNTEDATECFNRATQIWVDGGDATASRLALTYLCMGRVRMLQRNLTQAMEFTTWSEDLFVRTVGKDRGFMANVHYQFGNIHYRQNNLEDAWKDYDTCLKICLQDRSIHPIAAASYYSLGCVEYEMHHYDAAKMFLDKARKISELRSPTRDDGPIARILWKTSVVLASYSYDANKAEADELRAKADDAQQKLLAGGEGGFIQGSGRNEEEDSYDLLVPLFFR